MSGYITVPPSRAARARLGEIPGAGDIQYEPQSVEAPSGSMLPNGDGARFPELNEDSLWADHFFTVPAGAPDIEFKWMLVTPKRTRSFKYFMDLNADNKLCEFNCYGATPSSIVEHIVPLGGWTGRRTILGVWELADSPNSYYQAVDLLIE
ncbi:lytic polysaccharide monooxygenase [Umezawaea sp. Da 62-37]|uniref:lytic polysaccharide monooxygenase n=1 Tax=Umezawaea sp. Da 62-37 TaxID=3075927 RepID=UPI0028F6F24E|nr:lytic polysaccharide monooxygenase [Umezawaea sp. Da 62-37]WNV84918.1 chitin-binding protein [Umezawaea sp. Da 62-37]